MRTLFAAVFAIFLLFGCAQKEGLEIFSVDKPYAKALRWTQKGDIAVSLENKALIIATYLDPIDKRWDEERFFVRVYIDNDFDDPKKAGLHHPGFDLKLNGTKPLKIQEVAYESELVKSMPFVQPWYHFYIVTFAKSPDTKLRLTFSNKDYGAAVMEFVKPE